MATEIGGRPVLRPAGNVARKASKPPPSPLKPQPFPLFSKISPPNSPSPTPKKANSTCKQLQLPSPAPPSSIASVHLASESWSSDLSSENHNFRANLLSDVPNYVANLLMDEPDGSPSGSTPALIDTFPEMKPSLNDIKPSFPGINGCRPHMFRSKTFPSVSKPSLFPALSQAPPVSKTTINARISLTKSTSDAFQKGHVKTKPNTKKNLSKLGSLSFDEGSLATIVAAKKAAANEVNAQRKLKMAEYGRKHGKVSRVSPDVPMAGVHLPPVELKRCKFITAQTDPLYVAYHDEEWGVPVNDDRMLFELLVLAGFQAELSWTTILHKRDRYRAAFCEFNPRELAQCNEKYILLLEADKCLGLPGCKVRGVVENARRTLEVMREFGSLDEYLWGFLNKRPMMYNYRNAKQVPAKNSKAKSISKDLVRRGFRFVCPTIIYSFMQAAGMTNDHLVQCFRHQECAKLSSSSPPSADVVQKKHVEQSCELQSCKGSHHKEGKRLSRNLDFDLERGGGKDEHCAGPTGLDEWSHEPDICTNAVVLQEQESNDSEAIQVAFSISTTA